MDAKFVLLIVTLGTAIGFAAALHCGKVVEIQSKELLSYLASVNFPAAKPFHGHWNLTMKTDVPFTFLGGWGVIVEDNGPNKTATFQSANVTTFKKGEVVSFDFRIRWDVDSPMPKVQNIVWEGREICSGVDNSSPNAIKKLSSKGMRNLYSRRF